VRKQNSIEYQLYLLEDSIKQRPYPGYPDKKERLAIPYENLARNSEGRVILPEGTWTIKNHPDSTPDRGVTPLETKAFRRKGLEIDSEGLPLHPWTRQILKLGLAATRKGYYYEYGESVAVDSAIFQKTDAGLHVLTVTRKDTEELALPAGFVDPGEKEIQAGLRELVEETGLTLPKKLKATQKFQGLIVDPRITLHAFPSTTLHRYDLPPGNRLPEVEGKDDAKQAAFLPVHGVLDGQHGRIFPGARFLIEQALS
jgi:ADP-ribose pyrophosphatase YjhB (NUDIX family)